MTRAPDIPDDIMAAAIKLGNWMGRHGQRDWQLRDICDRNWVYKVEQLEKELMAMEARVSSDALVMAAEIDQAAAEINRCFEQVSPGTKAGLLRLGQALARIRGVMLNKNATGNPTRWRQQ